MRPRPVRGAGGLRVRPGVALHVPAEEAAAAAATAAPAGAAGGGVGVGVGREDGDPGVLARAGRVGAAAAADALPAAAPVHPQQALLLRSREDGEEGGGGLQGAGGEHRSLR